MPNAELYCDVRITPSIDESRKSPVEVLEKKLEFCYDLGKRNFSKYCESRIILL
jgi:hypothetical protein